MTIFVLLRGTILVDIMLKNHQAWVDFIIGLHIYVKIYQFFCPQNRPCKIVEMSTSKTGKHGHAKVHMVALDIFTGK